MNSSTERREPQATVRIPLYLVAGGFTGRELAVLIAIRAYADPEEICTASYADIAALTGLDRRKVGSVIGAILERPDAALFLTVEPGIGTKPSVFRFAMPDASVAVGGDTPKTATLAENSPSVAVGGDTSMVPKTATLADLPKIAQPENGDTSADSALQRSASVSIDGDTSAEIPENAENSPNLGYEEIIESEEITPSRVMESERSDCAHVAKASVDDSATQSSEQQPALIEAESTTPVKAVRPSREKRLAPAEKLLADEMHASIVRRLGTERASFPANWFWQEVSHARKLLADFDADHIIGVIRYAETQRWHADRMMSLGWVAKQWLTIQPPSNVLAMTAMAKSAGVETGDWMDASPEAIKAQLRAQAAAR